VGLHERVARLLLPAAAAQEQRQRRHGGDLRRGRGGRPCRRVDRDARQARVAPARLAVGDVPRHAPLIAQPGAAPARAVDDLLDAAAALAADELLVLLAQPSPGAEERALDAWPAHAEALADLAVREALELAHDEDLVVGLREPAEGPAEVVERELRVDRRVRRHGRAGEAPVVVRAERVVGVERDLVRVARPPPRVDAGVLRDLVDPRLEDDLRLGLAHAAQRRHEDLLRDVLGAPVVADHAAHVGGDPCLVAHIERLERAIVAGAHAGDEIQIIIVLICWPTDDCQGRHDFPYPLLCVWRRPSASCVRYVAATVEL
jgi:hypothetical protein